MGGGDGIILGMNRHQTDEIRVTVRPGRPADQGRILGLLDQARHQVVGFGAEDLAHMLHAGDHLFLIADTGALLWGFMVTSRLPQPARPGETEEAWAQLRGCALINGWQTENAIQALWEPLRALLRARGLRHVLHLGLAEWIVSPLQHAGFHVTDSLVTLERGTGIGHAGEGQGPAQLCAPAAGEVDALLALDTLAFDPPWRLTRGDLIGFMMMGGHFVVAESHGQVVGYAFSDVHREVGQLVRLAVLPAMQQQGIGSQLLSDALAFCRRAGARTFTLNTQDSNAASRQLYARHGLRVVGSRIPVMEYRIPRS